jgi:hypothetical protein
MRHPAKQRFVLGDNTNAYQANRIEDLLKDSQRLLRTTQRPVDSVAQLWRYSKSVENAFDLNVFREKNQSPIPP